MLTEMTPTESDTREPQRTREKTSRPRSSVPRRWPGLGGWSWSGMLTLIGSYGAMSGAKAATNRRIARRTTPTSMRGFLRRK